MNMFINMEKFERTVRAVLLALAAAAGTTALVIAEGVTREGSRFLPYRGIFEVPYFLAWGMAGGVAGILAGAFTPRRGAFWTGLAAGALPMLLVAILVPSDPWKALYYRPHPPGVAAYLLKFLLPILPGGVGGWAMKRWERTA